ncbi:MAG: hypothetical protein FWD05_04725 [Oscillospiraceae bacterium]|nr:hypothetical protein [Oscillospiraceae bacterium]
MFKFNTSKDYCEFDGIVLTFEKGSESWGKSSETLSFQTLGDFDRFTVTPISIEGFSVESSEAYFSRINEITKKSNVIKESDANHHLLGFTMMDEEDNSKKFWDIKSNYTFVSLVQFGQNFSSIEKSFKSLKLRLDKKKEDLEEIGVSFDYFVYLSLDISDLIIFIKTNDLKTVRKFIINIRKTFEDDIYSYSRAGLNVQQLLTSNELLDEVTISATISTPERFIQWIKKWEDRYSDRITVFEKLGYEDFYIRFNNINMSEIASELNDGLLSPAKFDEVNSYGYIDAIIRPRVMFYSEYTKVEDGRIRKPDLSETIFTKYENARKQGLNKHISDCMDYALLDMFKAVGMLEKNYFARDVVCCINSSFNKFISELESENKRIDSMLGSEPGYNSLKINRMELYTSLTKYLNANMSLIQGALQAERVFFQAPGFNIKLFDLQSKLVVFYMTYVKQLKLVLSDKNPGFDVVFNIGLHHQITMNEFFSIDNSAESFDNGALIAINIPISSLYKPSCLMLQLTHEIAHISANEFRCRTERMRQIVFAVSKLFADNVFVKAMLSPGDDKWTYYSNILFPTHDVCRDVRQFIHEQVFEHMVSILEKYQPQPLDNNEIEFYLTARKMKNTLEKTLLEFVSQYHMELFLPKICDKIYKLNNPISDDMNYFMNAISAFVCKVYQSSGTTVLYDISPFTGVVSLMEESYSDLIMLKTSNCNYIEYLRSVMIEMNRFFEDSPEYVKHLLPDYTVQRICSVLKVQFGIENICDTVPNILEEMADNDLVDFVFKINEAIQGDLHLHNTLVPHTVAYLQKCNRKWKDCFDDPRRQKHLNEVRATFMNMTNAKTLKEFMTSFMNTYQLFFDKYENI